MKENEIASFLVEANDNYKSIENLSSRVKFLEEKEIAWHALCVHVEKSVEALVEEAELLNAKVASLDLARKEAKEALEAIKSAIEEQHVIDFQKVA